ncbi:hypothetical protein AUR04nite_11540 [Glutamicibacter uratoxydans]|uniref:Uncharacterized protein n=1 Tax=Glutamicibacter uratoxydans TaxID=43667 RepID=A0A4Y4DK01_GLUUR|nr:hypothetical protein [Glutamicibacter uratoxydans]GED05622.1 hypothetical protein AUR04nite_11540 [Glutamicibacter uratoxydans]
MRKVISVIAMLLGAAALVVGIGQKTFWAPPETVTATMPQLDGTAPLTLIESSVNSEKLAPVELVITGDGEFTASLGRSFDVDSWVGDAAHVSVTGIDTENHQMQASFVDGKKEVPNPKGGDVFFDSQTADGTMTYRWTAPDSGDWSLLLAADGKADAPTNISVTYANNAAMPFALPLIIAGALLLVFGLALLVMRTGKGAAAPAAKSTSQHSIAAAAVVALAVSGVAVPMAPKDDASATPTESAATETPATETAPAEATASGEGAEQAAPAAFPVVTEEQLTRILADVQKQVGKADDEQDAKALEARAAGAFKYIRSSRYDILKDDIKVTKPLALNTSVLRSAAVPNTSEAKFPRVISVVTAKDADAETLPIALTLVQNSARDNYKVVFAEQMLPGASFPGIAVGDPSIKQLDAKAEGLQQTPAQALKSLADVLSNEKSKAAGKFADSEFIKAIHADQKDESKEANEAKVKYSRSVTEGDTKAVSTPDGGAIVTGKLNQKAVFERTEDSDPLKGKDDLTKKLLGKASSTGDVEINYAEPVMIYVPAEGSDEKIQLIAAEVVLLNAKEVK